MCLHYERRSKKDPPGKSSPSLTGQVLRGSCISVCCCRGTLDRKISRKIGDLNLLKIQSLSVLRNDTKNLYQLLQQTNRTVCWLVK